MLQRYYWGWRTQRPPSFQLRVPYRSFKRQYRFNRGCHTVASNDGMGVHSAYTLFCASDEANARNFAPVKAGLSENPILDCLKPAVRFSESSILSFHLSAPNFGVCPCRRIQFWIVHYQRPILGFDPLVTEPNFGFSVWPLLEGPILDLPLWASDGRASLSFTVPHCPGAVPCA